MRKALWLVLAVLSVVSLERWLNPSRFTLFAQSIKDNWFFDPGEFEAARKEALKTGKPLFILMR